MRRTLFIPNAILISVVRLPVPVSVDQVLHVKTSADSLYWGCIVRDSASVNSAVALIKLVQVELLYANWSLSGYMS
jgi:hypothetical protein